MGLDANKPRAGNEEKKVVQTKTLIVVILDQSGSMQAQKADIIGGYNCFVESQLAVTEDKARLVLIKFSTEVTVYHAAMEIENTPKLTSANFIPAGGTALYDAVAEGVRIAEATVMRDERVLVLIMTDGEENSSKKASGAEVKKLIAGKEALGNWTFTYIGQNPEAWARSMAQSVGNVARYDMQSQRSNMLSAAAATVGFRQQQLPQSASFYRP